MKAQRSDYREAAHLISLADRALAKSNYADAERLYKLALATDQKSFGRDHLYVAEDLNLLALLYETQGNDAAAESLYEQALAIAEKALGPDDPSLAGLQTNVAEFYEKIGRRSRAEGLKKRARRARQCARCGNENLPGSSVCSRCRFPLPRPIESLVPPVQPARDGGFNLRTVGDLIGETFRIYRRNFRPLLSIALAPLVIVPLVVIGIALVLGLLSNLALPRGDIIGLGGLLLVLAAAFLFPVVGGAAIHLVVLHYLGRDITLEECFRQGWKNVLVFAIALILVGLAEFWYTFLGGALSGFLAAVLIAFGLPPAGAIAVMQLVIVAIALYLQVSFWFVTHVIMVERRGPIAALRRSRELVRGSWWWVFGLMIVFGLIGAGLAVGIIIPGGILVKIVGSGTAKAVMLVTAFVTGLTLYAPTSLVWMTLVYFHLRVTKENFNLKFLRLEIDVSPSPRGSMKPG